jgi:hypothetical protein
MLGNILSQRQEAPLGVVPSVGLQLLIVRIQSLKIQTKHRLNTTSTNK